MSYMQHNKAYEFDEWDEENDCPIPGKVAGYKVFSTIQVGKYTYVRAVTENKTGHAVRSNARIWFVEWKVTFGVSSATHRVASRMTRSDAIREGERYAAMIAEQDFQGTEDAGAFYALHPGGRY